MSSNLVAHEWNSNSRMSSRFSELSATLLHSSLMASLSQLRLRPINIAAEGQTPGDQSGRCSSDHHQKVLKKKKKSVKKYKIEMAWASALSVGAIRAGRPRHKQLQSRGRMVAVVVVGGGGCFLWDEQKGAACFNIT